MQDSPLGVRLGKFYVPFNEPSLILTWFSRLCFRFSSWNQCSSDVGQKLGLPTRCGHGRRTQRKRCRRPTRPCLGTPWPSTRGGEKLGKPTFTSYHNNAHIPQEGFSPDPYLTGQLMAETVQGIQSAGVIACSKHYIGNEQEHFRRGEQARGYGWNITEASTLR